MDCEIDFHFSIGKTSIEFGWKETNCKKIGEVPIYKDMQERSGTALIGNALAAPSELRRIAWDTWSGGAAPKLLAGSSRAGRNRGRQAGGVSGRKQAFQGALGLANVALDLLGHELDHL